LENLKWRPLGRSRSRREDDTKMNLKRYRVGGCRMDSTGSGKGPEAGPCEHGNEPSGSIKVREFLD